MFLALQPFGPIISIPVVTTIAGILGMNSLVYDGILNKCFQGLMTASVYGSKFKHLFSVPPIDYDTEAKL